MQFVRIDFWPAGLVFASAALIALVLRSLERYAHGATARRTRRVLQQALDQTHPHEHAAPVLRGGADTGVG